MLKHEIGSSIRKERRLNDWTQKELAEKLNMSVNHISMIERGDANPSLETVAKIAELFNKRVVISFKK
mgnify:CR=1 FL=1